MNRKIAGLTLCGMLLLPAVVRADVWSGKTEATQTELVRVSADGILEEMDLRVGQYVKEGQPAGRTKVEKVFSPIDGIVSNVRAMVGEEVYNDTVLSLESISPYFVYCTTSSAYPRPENTLIHIGDTVYVRCAEDGTHRGFGRVIDVEEEEFEIEIEGGELFMGEAVAVFRDSSFEREARIGKGTVIPSNALDYVAVCNNCQNLPSIGSYVYVESKKGGDSRLATVTSVTERGFEVEMSGSSFQVGESLVFYSYQTMGGKGSQLATGSFVQKNNNDLTATGVILSINVEDGEEVERGQLLYTCASTDSPSFFCGAEGWITEVNVSEGQKVWETDIAAKIATQVRLSVSADRHVLSKVHVGTVLRYWTVDDPHDLRDCRVTGLLLDTANDSVTLQLEPLIPGERLLPIGLSVFVTDEIQEN